MLAVIYLVALVLAGIAVVQRFMPSAPVMVRISGGFLLGIVGGAWATYAVALALSPVTDESLLIGIIVATVAAAAAALLLRQSLRLSWFKLSLFELVFLGAALVFSFWLMDNRLLIAQDAVGDPLMVSSETWGDTALHVALSQSFSEGANYPTEYPFFAGEPIRYHFGYDFFAGALQEGGFSVLLSFNLPGALGFAAMMALLFSIARMLFSRNDGLQRAWWRDTGVWAGLIAVSLLLTNQSLEFIRYFERTGDLGDALNPHNWWNLGERPEWQTGYLSIGPYTQDKIAIFNTLNVFLTQTHLIIGMGVVLFVAFGLLQPLRFGQPLPRQRMLLLGVLFGLSFWLNGVLYIAAGVFFGSLLVIFAVAGARRHAERFEAEERRVQFGREFRRWTELAAWFIVPALALAVPQAFALNGYSLGNDDSFRMHVGYLVCSSPNSSCYANGEMDLLTLSHWGEFVNYWLLNQGLMLPLLVVAIVIGSRFDQKVIAAVLAVFVFGSLVQLSRDLGGHNHKVFNLFEILASLFVANVLVVAWNAGGERLGRLGVAPIARIAAFVVVPMAFFFLVLSGLLDFMTIKNDWEVPVFGDHQATIDWIDENTDADAVFVTAWGELYTAPTLAGRGVFLGYDPWASSAGYDVEPRKAVIAAVYSAQSKAVACQLLTENGIDYVLVGPAERAGQKFVLNEAILGEFTQAASLPFGASSVEIYDVAASCGGVPAGAG